MAFKIKKSQMSFHLKNIFKKEAMIIMTF